MIDWMDEYSAPAFPATDTALDNPNGLLAAGGRLSPEWLLKAYPLGIFPWYEDDSPILWWSPAPRAVITPTSFRIPRTVRKLLKRSRATITCNQAFDAVVEHCATIQRTDEDGSPCHGTWITTDMQQAYKQLNRAGPAISIEYWNAEQQLAGGFYGVLLGPVFFGESMFSIDSNASQLAFAAAAPCLFKQGVRLIDCQMNTQHMARFGLIEYTRQQFEFHLHQKKLPQPHSHSRLPTLIHSGPDT